MGVERFFSSINKEFNITENTEYPYKKLDCKYFFIDFNSIVHTISQHMINVINTYIENNMENCPFEYKNIDMFEKQLLSNIVDYVVDMLENNINSNNLETLYIAIDGVPTMAKMYEQKKRRYMAVILNSINTKVKKPFGWSKNNISPGTNFMKQLQNVLKSSDFKNRIKSTCNNIKSIIITDTTSPDEGEIKIINYIKNNKISLTEKIVVYSPDSDMIILLLLLDHNINILRYDQQKSILDNDFNGKLYNLIYVDRFKKSIYDYIVLRVNNYDIDKRKLYDDTVFILTVFGDDFLPKLETLRVSNDIFLILDYYIVNYIRSGHLIEFKKKYIIRTQSFYNFLSLVGENELLFLKRNMKNHVYSNYFKMEESIVSSKLFYFRDLLNEYVWKFIYLNRTNKIKHNTINNINVSEHFTLEYFFDKLQGNEPIIDNTEVMKYSNHKHKYMDKIILKELKKIFMEYYLEIIRIIDNKKLYRFITDNKMIRDRTNIFKNYNMLYYLIDNKDNLFFDFILYFFVNNSLPVTISLYKEHGKLLKVNYSSNTEPHSRRLIELDKYEKIQYMMDFKLDEFTSILNPKDVFYHTYFTDTFPKREEIENYYKVHFEGIEKNKIVMHYMEGLNWVVNYYFNFIFDKTWSYSYSKSPLIYDILNNFNKDILLQVVKDKYTVETFFTPLEQLVFISPLKLDEDLMKQLLLLNKILSFDDLQKLYKFIKSHDEYFFEINKIVKSLEKSKIIDCSNSIFLSKCHLIFLEKEINIDNYLKDFRKVFPLEYQRKYYPLNV